MPAANLTKIPKPQNDAWVLRLYVAGQTPKSVTAFANLKKICAEHLADKYRIELIDLLEKDGRLDERLTANRRALKSSRRAGPWRTSTSATRFAGSIERGSVAELQARLRARAERLEPDRARAAVPLGREDIEPHGGRAPRALRQAPGKLACLPRGGHRASRREARRRRKKIPSALLRRRTQGRLKRAMEALGGARCPATGVRAHSRHRRSRIHRQPRRRAALAPGTRSPCSTTSARASARTSRGAQLFVVDVRDLDATRGSREFKPDVVSHQAAQASVSVSMRDPALDAAST